MKIHQLLSGLSIPLTNQEQQFIEQYDYNVKVTSLDESDQWIAQGLVRKGIYSIGRDDCTLIKNIKNTDK